MGRLVHVCITMVHGLVHLPTASNSSAVRDIRLGVSAFSEEAEAEAWVLGQIEESRWAKDSGQEESEGTEIPLSLVPVQVCVFGFRGSSPL